MTRKNVTDLAVGDVVMTYTDEGEYVPLATVVPFEPNEALDPGLDDAMLRFTLETASGTRFNRFYAPVGAVVVQ